MCFSSEKNKSSGCRGKIATLIYQIFWVRLELSETFRSTWQHCARRVPLSVSGGRQVTFLNCENKRSRCLWAKCVRAYCSFERDNLKIFASA